MTIEQAFFWIPACAGMNGVVQASLDNKISDKG